MAPRVSASLVVLVLALCALSAPGAQGKRTGGAIVPRAAVACPGTTPCQFFFGATETISTVTLTGVKPNTPISGNLTYPSNTTFSFGAVNAGPATFYPSGTINGLSNLFYLTGSKPARLAARDFNQVKPADIAGQCILLPIKSAQVYIGNNLIYNLNPGDNNKVFSEAGRCVVFQAAA